MSGEWMSDLLELHYEPQHDCEGSPVYCVRFTGDMYANMHDDMEIVVVHQGCLRLYVDEVLWQLYAGDVFIINAGRIHFGIAEMHTSYSVILQEWSRIFPKEPVDPEIGKLYRLIHGELLFLPRVIREQEDGALYAAVQEIHTLLETQPPAWKLSVIGAYFRLAAICDAAGYLRESADADREQSALRKNDIALYIQFTRYVNRHFSEKLSLPAIAKALQVSESRLYKTCKKIQGYPPVLFISNHRLMRAGQMLQYSEKSVTEICYACGFENISYFITKFREFYGMTPQQFRTKNTEK